MLWNGRVALVCLLSFSMWFGNAKTAWAGTGWARARHTVNGNVCFTDSTTPTALTGSQAAMEYRNFSNIDTFGEKANIVLWVTTRSDFDCGADLSAADLRNAWIEVGYLQECANKNGCDSPDKKLYVGEKRRNRAYERVYEALPTGIAEHDMLVGVLIPADSTGSRWRALIGKNGSAWALNVIVPDPRRWSLVDYPGLVHHTLGHRADAGIELRQGTESVPPLWMLPRGRLAGSSSWYSWGTLNLDGETTPPPCASASSPWLLVQANTQACQ